jgi:hypothetical protein
MELCCGALDIRYITPRQHWRTLSALSIKMPLASIPLLDLFSKVTNLMRLFNEALVNIT